MKSIVPLFAALAITFAPTGQAQAAAKDPHVQTAAAKAKAAKAKAAKAKSKKDKAAGKRLALRSSKVLKAAPAAAVIDYDSEPFKLMGQRASGGLVGMEGLSEGTRDQLYLALRLAALELHLQHTAPIPLIADDLFINYDDARAKAGLQALAHLSQSTQVIFLTHHAHLVPVAQGVLGEGLNVVRLD